MKTCALFLVRVMLPLLIVGGGIGWLGGNVIYFLAYLIDIPNTENNYIFIVLSFSGMGLVLSSYACFKAWAAFSSQ